MTTPKQSVIASINTAKANLEKALIDVEHLPSFDPGAFRFAAHAMGNYLAVVQGSVQLLSRELEDHPSAKVHRWLHGVEHANNLMTQMVGQLLHSSSTAELKLICSKFDLATLVRNACQLYQRIADEKNISMTVETSLKEAAVWADGVALAAVLDNLLSNAVKYSPPGKQIFVRLVSESGSLVCSVIDQGPGLSMEDQARLYRKGVRLSAVPTGGEPSTGYGLAVAKELINQLGGELWCVSRLGEGACFSFRLPLYMENKRGPSQSKTDSKIPAS